MLFVGVSLPLAHATKAHPTNVVSTRPNEDEDNDGLTNQEEAEFDTFPYNAYSDADSVMDGEDGWALNPNFSPPRIPTTQYAVVQIDLGGDTPVAINNSAQVAATSSNWTASFWEKGEKTALPVPPTSDTSGIRPVGINDSGVVLCNGWTYGNGPSEDPQGSRSYSGVWQKGGALTELYSFFGTEGTERVRAGSFAVSLNDVGQVVGNAEGGTIHYDDQGVPSYNENLHYPSALWSTAGGSPAHLLPDDQSRTVSGQAINNHGVSVVARYANGLGLLSVVEGGAETPLGEGYPNYINDGNMIVGWRGNQPAIWYKKDGNGQWLSEAIDVRGRINNQYQIIDSTGFKSVVWQNAKSYLLSNLGPSRAGWSEYINAVDINDHGIILASSFRVRDADGNPVSPSGWVPILLIPVDVAVDANRDGFIKFAGNYNASSVSGKATDTTSLAQPFRFWCNDDDRTNKDHPGSTTKDSTNSQIESFRDLEDFTRLYLYIGGLQDSVADGTFSVGLEWRNTDGTSPAIKVYQAAEVDGGDQYLRTALGAANQATGTKATALGTVSSSSSFKFPASFWEGDVLTGRPELSEENPNRHVIFEGSGEGKGQLVLTFWKGTEKIGEGGGVWLDIKDIKKMYQSSFGDVFEKPENEAKEAIVFVHGWNMSPDGSRNFAETMFKRVWQRGFKGRFAYFRWNTNWSDAFDNVPLVGQAAEAYFAQYNNSEYTAWTQGGPQLKAFVEQLPNDYTKNIAAHSMGNIVAGSALSGGLTADNYALMQAAVPAACYDDRTIINQTQITTHSVSFGVIHVTNITVWDEESPDDDPDSATRNLAYRGMLNNIGQNCNLINFYLEADQATSYAWEINNDTTKPSGPLAGHFRYNRSNPNGQKLYKDYGGGIYDYMWLSRYESMSFACRTWGKAVGAEGRTEGAIPASSKVNLGSATFQLPGESQGSGFGDEHSGQFNDSIQYLKLFYDTLLDKLQVERNP